MNAASLDPRIPPMSWGPTAAAVAHHVWGFNGGHAAVCVLTGLTPEQLRQHCYRAGGLHIGQDGSVVPGDMKDILLSIGVLHDYRSLPMNPVNPWPEFGVSRLQLGGPWMRSPTNLAVRRRHTRWMASCKQAGGPHLVFDLDALGLFGRSGWLERDAWAELVVPELLSNARESDGTWWLTHAIELRPVMGAAR